jgi:GNAT superfamily N-acetyltransferase
LRLRQLRGIRPEIERVDRLVKQAYGFQSRRNDLETYLAAQPDGWFVILDGGEIVSVGGALAYGPFCWLGLMATDPARQRQGLATKISAHLVVWARERGCTTIALDASPAGRPVYERLGFQAVGETAELSLPPAVHRENSSGTIRPASEGIEQLLALDRRTFGGDRSGLLHAVFRQDDARCYIASSGDEVAGYMFARQRLLGPGCALNDAVARDLLHAALADQAPTSRTDGQRLLLPIESRYLDLLCELGLRIERRLAHMRLGDPVLPGAREQLLAQTSYAAG